MPAPKPTVHWLILSIFGFVGALLLFGIAMQQSDLRALLSPPPVEISFQKLREAPPGTNKHIQLTPFALSQNFAVEKERDTWRKVWIPAFDPNERDPQPKAELVVKTPYPRTEKDVDELASQPGIKGILRRKSALETSARSQLEKIHPGVDFSDAWVLEEVRHVPSEDVIRWCNIAGAALGVVGVGLLALWFVQRRKHAPPREDFMPEPIDDDPAKRGLVVAEFPSGSKLHYFVLISALLLAAMFLAVWVVAILAAVRVEEKDAGLVVGLILATLFMGGFGFFFLAGFVYAIVALAWKLIIHENGVLVQKRRSARWIPWTIVRSYREQNVILNGVSTGHQIHLLLKTGKTYKIESLFKNVSAAIDAIKGRLVPFLIREAEVRLKNDHAVDFDYAIVRREGLECGDRTIAWDQIDSIAIEDRSIAHNLVVRAEGRKEPILDVAVPRFPSVEVFLAMVQSRMPQ